MPSLLLYEELLLPEERGTLPDGLLYEAVDFPDEAEDWVGLLEAVVLPEAVVLLPEASLTAAERLVPNELLLVVEIFLAAGPDEGDEDPPANILLPDVSMRDPLYTSLL